MKNNHMPYNLKNRITLTDFFSFLPVKMKDIQTQPLAPDSLYFGFCS